MSSDKKKTAAILCAAGALVATAMILDRSPAEGKTGEMTTVGQGKTTEAPPPVTARCDNKAPARTSAEFARGTLGAGLSAGKILRGTGGQVYAAFDLTTAPDGSTERPPLNVAVVIDRSGSMEGKPLQQAKDAASRFIDQLSDRDRMALVQYDDTAQVVVASTPLDREGRARLRSAVTAMRVGGSTNLHGGMALGRDEVQRTFQSGQVSRVILMSDGKANTGVTDSGEIAEAARQAADRGVRITSVGIGLDYNEDLMETIAEAGRGNYYYVRDAGALDAVMAGELKSIQGTVATAVELRLDAACDGVEIAEVLGYESRKDGAATVVPMADLTGNDSRKLLVALRVPDRSNGRIGALSGELSYKDAKSGATVKTRVALALEVTDDHVAVESSIDKDVMAMVLKQQAATSLRAAADAYEKGDKEGAMHILQASETKMEEDRASYGVSASAVAPAMSSLRGMAADAKAYDPGDEGGKDLLKKNKAAARDLSKGK
jgi:Ca-activated chloride channel family protein